MFSFFKFLCCNSQPVIWTDKIPVTKRFKLVLDGFAVLDNETGLVWEKTPSESVYNWNDAVVYCRHKAIGGRMGWRLPVVEELASLIEAVPGVRDYGGGVLPPDGHPFELGTNSSFWTATLAPYNFRNTFGTPAHAYHINTGPGSHLDSDSGEGNTFRTWCVRGGFNSIL